VRLQLSLQCTVWLELHRAHHIAFPTRRWRFVRFLRPASNDSVLVQVDFRKVPNVIVEVWEHGRRIECACAWRAETLCFVGIFKSLEHAAKARPHNKCVRTECTAANMPRSGPYRRAPAHHVAAQWGGCARPDFATHFVVTSRIHVCAETITHAHSLCACSQPVDSIQT
jgi:hypothetical protein